MITQEELKAEANKDATTSKYRVSVLYGDYGKRKTCTACAMVNERGLLLSADDSWKVLLNTRHRGLLDKVKKIIKLEGLKQLEYIDFDGYDTIIWDTVSHSVDTYLDILYDESDWGGKYREKLKTTNKELKDLEILAPVDYRVTRDGFRPVLNRLFNNTNAHIIFTSHMTIPLPGLSQDQLNRPSIPAATFKIIGTRADLIANLRAANRKFVADVTESSLTYLGKSRIEGIQGAMDLDSFVNTYKEIVFK